jgi:predicted nuclease of predicted toxin-antitoxin system
MKILVDENLPLRLPKELADLFPNVDHASKLGLRSKPDSEIWRYAVSQGYMAILTADADFQSRALELGPTPKVIRIERCDFSAKEIVALLRREAVRIHDFLASPRSLLVLRRATSVR